MRWPITIRRLLKYEKRNYHCWIGHRQRSFWRAITPIFLSRGSPTSSRIEGGHRWRQIAQRRPNHKRERWRLRANLLSSRSSWLPRELKLSSHLRSHISNWLAKQLPIGRRLSLLMHSFRKELGLSRHKSIPGLQKLLEPSILILRLVLVWLGSSRHSRGCNER